MKLVPLPPGMLLRAALPKPPLVRPGMSRKLIGPSNGTPPQTNTAVPAAGPTANGTVRKTATPLAVKATVLVVAQPSNEIDEPPPMEAVLEMTMAEFVVAVTLTNVPVPVTRTTPICEPEMPSGLRRAMPALLFGANMMSKYGRKVSAVPTTSLSSALSAGPPARIAQSFGITQRSAGRTFNGFVASAARPDGFSLRNQPVTRTRTRRSLETFQSTALSASSLVTSHGFSGL